MSRDPTRRDGLHLLAGAAVALGLQGCATEGGEPMNTGETAAGAIDVHAHYIPDFYREAAVAAGHAQPDGMPGFPAWSPAEMLAMMDRQGIARAYLSISSPGVHFGDDAAAGKLARAVNEEAARTCKAHPGRFGFFASLPLPDVAGALAEAELAFDGLDADGVVMESNHDGVRIGDPALDPLLEMLNRRKAVVFLHPTSPKCSCGVGHSPALPAPILEFMFETTRAVTNIILARVPTRFPDIRFIIPHAGAAVPALADRIAMVAGVFPALAGLTPADVIRQLGGFYYDMAGAPLPRLLPTLRTFADDGKLLYGSDYPFTTEPLVGRLRAALEGGLAKEPDLLAAIRSGNAGRLFG